MAIVAILALLDVAVRLVPERCNTGEIAADSHARSVGEVQALAQPGGTHGHMGSGHWSIAEIEDHINRAFGNNRLIPRRDLNRDAADTAPDTTGPVGRAAVAVIGGAA